VVQETFVRVYFKAGKFLPKSSVKTWIYAIALNLCRDQFRRLARHRGEFSVDVPPLADAPRMELADRAPSPSAQASSHDRFAQLQRAIDLLPEKLREALILFSIEQRSQQEVAETLGITPKAVETRVYHAKARLRTLLGSYAL
jgi:RNA polymerase sigma factor CnrH